MADLRPQTPPSCGHSPGSIMEGGYCSECIQADLENPQSRLSLDALEGHLRLEAGALIAGDEFSRQELIELLVDAADHLRANNENFKLASRQAFRERVERARKVLLSDDDDALVRFLRTGGVPSSELTPERFARLNRNLEYSEWYRSDGMAFVGQADLRALIATFTRESTT